MGCDPNLVGHKTDNLIANKDNVLSPTEIKAEWHVRAYSGIDKCALVNFKGQDKGKATSEELADPMNRLQLLKRKFPCPSQ